MNTAIAAAAFAGLLGLGAPLPFSGIRTASTEAISAVAITPASLVMEVDGALIMVDPVGDQGTFRAYGRPDIVVLTRASEEHLSIDTMIGLLRRDTVVLAPQSVID